MNSAQKQRLIKIMKTKHDLLFNRISNCNADRRQIWEEIAKDINSLGPPIKDAECWLLCWNSLQTGIKNKLKYHREKGHNQRQTLNHDDQVIIDITGIPVSRYDFLPSKKANVPVVLNHSLPPVLRTYTRLRTRITHNEGKKSDEATNLTMKTPCQTDSSLAAELNQDQSNSPKIEALVRRSSCNTEPADIPLASQGILADDMTISSATQANPRSQSTTPVSSTAQSNSIIPCDLTKMQPRPRRRYVSLKYLLIINY